MNIWILALILHYAQVNKIDPLLALSVVKVESNFDPSTVGPTNDVGLFQLNPKSFRSYSKKQLLDPETNVKLGTQYLAEMKRDCVHQDGISWLVCYNYGVENAKHVKHANLFPYVRKVKAQMEEFKHGEKVLVKGLYDLRLDGYGTYLGISQEPHYRGYYRVENEYGQVMRIHPDRVKKCEE